MQTDAVSGIFSIWALTNKETHSPWVGGQPQDNLVTGTAEPPQLEDCRSKHQKINKNAATALFTSDSSYEFEI